MRKFNPDSLLAQREHSLKAQLAKHADEKHTDKNKRYYASGYCDAWRDLIDVLKKQIAEGRG